MLLDPTELSNKASIGFCHSSAKPKGEAALCMLTCQFPLTSAILPFMNKKQSYFGHSLLLTNLLVY